MKKILTSLFLLLPVLVATAQEKSCTLRLTAAKSKLQGEWLVIGSQGKKIDSIKFDAKGALIKLVPAPQELYTAKAGTYRIVFVPEAGLLKADIVKDEAAKGTPINDALHTLVSSSSKVVKAFRAKAEQINKDSKLKPEDRDAKMEALSNEVEQEYKQINLDAFRRHLNDPIGGMALKNVASMVSPEEFVALYDQTGQSLKQDKEIERSYRLSKSAILTSEGKDFVNIVGVNPQDTTQAIHLADYVGKGRYVLADFWASWCGPCRREMKNLKKAYELYHGKGLDIVGVGVWDKFPDNQTAIVQMQLLWPMLYDSTLRACADAYGVMGIPTIILFDKDGKILSRSLHGEELIQKLQELMP